jgi:hypothetical protein
MKRVLVLLIAFLIAFALVSCNVAPNVPRVSPYVTNGNGNYYNNIQGGAYGPPAYGTNNRAGVDGS